MARIPVDTYASVDLRCPSLFPTRVILLIAMGFPKLRRGLILATGSNSPEDEDRPHQGRTLVFPELCNRD